MTISWSSGLWGEGVWGGGAIVPAAEGVVPVHRSGFAATLAIDPATGDLPKRPYIIRGVPAIAQRIRSRLQFFAGEYFLDQRQGLPYFQAIFGRVENPQSFSITIVDAIYRKAIETTPGIVRVDSITSTLDRPNRILRSTWVALADDDLILTAVDEPFIIFGNQNGRSF